MVNGEFKFKDVTWQQRKEMRKALEEAGYTFTEIAKKNHFPTDFMELAFRYGIEGFEDPEKLNELDELHLSIGAAGVFERVFFKLESEKKS